MASCQARRGVDFFLYIPGFPVSYPSNLHCVWTIKPQPGFKVVGQFTEFDLTHSENCESDYVQTGGKHAILQFSDVTGLLKRSIL